MGKTQGTVGAICKAVALGASVASLVLVFLGVTDVDTRLTLPGIGLFALALAALQKEGWPEVGARQARHQPAG